MASDYKKRGNPTLLKVVPRLMKSAVVISLEKRDRHVASLLAMTKELLRLH
jgi:hypothetical protein